MHSDISDSQDPEVQDVREMGQKIQQLLREMHLPASEEVEKTNEDDYTLYEQEIPSSRQTVLSLGYLLPRSPTEADDPGPSVQLYLLFDGKEQIQTGPSITVDYDSRKKQFSVSSMFLEEASHPRAANLFKKIFRRPQKRTEESCDNLDEKEGFEALRAVIACVKQLRTQEARRPRKSLRPTK